MKGLAAILGVAAVMVVAAACGNGGETTSIGQALGAAERSEVTVSGHLIVGPEYSVEGRGLAVHPYAPRRMGTHTESLARKDSAHRWHASFERSRIWLIRA